MYTTRNFKTKKQLKEAVERGEAVSYFQPGQFGGNECADGVISIEGPHYPEPHRWYARCVVKNGVIITVR